MRFNKTDGDVLLTAIVGLLFMALASGCMSAAVQTREIAHHPPAVREQVQLVGVPFIKQSAGYCGPATLTMAMQWAGKEVAVDDIAPEVYTPSKDSTRGGSLQMDMISAGRRHGLTTVPIQGLVALLKELDAGHPVIVFENLGLSWIPQWHYAIVFGYNLETQKLLMHSGPDQYKEESMAEFELSWRLADYWGMVVLGPNELSATGDELAHAASAAAMENLGLTDEALQAYKAILKKWPHSVSSYIGLGNITYQQGNLQSSVDYLQKAVEIAPGLGAAQHNLLIAEKALQSEKKSSQRE